MENVVRESNMARRGQRLGLLLVGHGTRDARGVSEFLSLADQVAGRLPNVFVRPGFLELAEPTIRDAVEAITSRGVDAIVVVPALIFPRRWTNCWQGVGKSPMCRRSIWGRTST